MPLIKKIVIIKGLEIVGDNDLAILRCPIMSNGTDGNYVVCQQEDCAWYLKNYKSCSVYILAHDAALNIKAKQQQKK